MSLTPARVTTEVEVVRAYWHLRGEVSQMTPNTVARYERVFASFVRFARASGCDSIATVTSQLCLAFVHAPRQGGHKPASSTSRFRLTVIRDGYLALQRAGMARSDPTSGLRVKPSTQARRPEPLTPPETARLRSAGRLFPRDHQRPTTVELALAGASHTEIALTVIADLDLRRDRVRLGSRWADLDGFAMVTLTARVAACRRASRRERALWDPGATPLALRKPLAAYPATSVAPSISSSLSRAMDRAGLIRAGLRPASLREYAANLQYALSGRVETVAELLGLTSLDVARGFVNPVWQEQFADEVRAVERS